MINYIPEYPYDEYYNICPLQLAVESSDLQSFKVLLSRGARTDLLDNPLHISGGRVTFQDAQIGE